MSARIIELHRYPVKSMGGEALDAATLGEHGIPGDRAWALRSTDDGSVKIGKQSPLPQGARAEFLEEPTDTQRSAPVRITLPDGRTVASTDANASEVLSDALGTGIALQGLLPPESQLRRQPPPPGTDIEAYLRGLFARTSDEPLPDMSIWPPELAEFEAPPGTWFDAFPLLVLTTSTLAALTDHRGESNFDVRRFRPNILMEIDEAGFPENAWAGRRAQLGSAVLQFEMACPRCIMTTHGFDDLPKDPGVMRALVQANSGNAGIYARVVQSGGVRIGDTLVLED